MKRRIVLTLLFSFSILLAVRTNAQNTGTLMGSIKDKESQELLYGATVKIEGTAMGAAADTAGRFKITDIPAGSYNITFQFLGYETYKAFNVVINTGNASILNIELQPESKNLNEVVVTDNSFGKKSETPLSIQKLTSEEIKSNPGGNFDISKVLQVLPGVGSTAGTGGSFRNDIIIRGGAPNENVYYLDGMEIPQLNHFSTQGSAGGPQGILNVSFIDDVTLSASSFEAKYSNALSSVLSFRQKDGNPEKLEGNVRLSGSELALTLDGPIDKNTTFLASARRSYLEFLFAALNLPIRPNYWDFQYKVTHKIDSKTTLTAIGLGAIDEFTFAVPKNATASQEYIILGTPYINQWNYMMGFSLKRLLNKGYMNIALTRNMFNDALDQFKNGETGNESMRSLKIRSQEIENKFTLDVNKFEGSWKFSYGVNAQYDKYNINSFVLIRDAAYDSAGALVQPRITSNFTSAIDLWRFGAFASANKKLLQDRLSLTLGLRTDMNTWLNTGMNPGNTISPRFTASYTLSDKWTLNATVGRYYKLPIYPVLGYKDSTGKFVNKDNKYITCDHYVTGLEYRPSTSGRLTIEGFLKRYSNYPISERYGISLANEGGDFGIIGNERVLSIGEGQSYGIELCYQQKLVKNFFATVSYTLFWSEFTTATGKYVPSAWDNRNLVSLIAGYKFGKGWEAGAKFRYSGGSPYTPFDLEASRINYLSTGNGILDYSQLNTLRLESFKELDVRIDKKFNGKKVTWDIYADVTNVLAFKSPSLPAYTFQRNADNSGFATTDGKPVAADGSNAIPLILNTNSSTVVPTLGFILEF